MKGMLARRTPKLITALKNYSAHDFVSDVIAGLTVGLVALPLAKSNTGARSTTRGFPSCWP